MMNITKFEEFLYNLKKLDVKKIGLADVSIFDMKNLDYFIENKKAYFIKINYEHLLKSYLRSLGIFMRRYIIK